MKCQPHRLERPTAGAIEMLPRMAGTVEHLAAILTAQHPLAMRERVEAWLFSYHTDGLSFAESKDEAEMLRDLVGRGLVASQGRTKATAHRLTWSGLMATHPRGTAEKTIDLLVRIDDMAEAAGRGTGLPEEIKVVMGSRLVPCDCPADVYRDRLATFATDMSPLIVMGWIDVYTDITGRRWAVAVTEPGRKALEQAGERRGVVEGYADIADQWLAGWDAANRFTRSDPPGMTGALAYRLTAG